MARKNRPTLIQQFSDFINRVAPFDGNALIQKTEHNQVEDDLFDSLLNNTDSSDLINSPSAAINLDFSAFDMYRINSSGSGETSFNITINNLGTGQVARVHITKKNNDSYSFTNAVLGQISNLSQTGSILSFFIHNVNGVLVAYADITIAKSNSITDTSADKLATSKAVSDLNAAKLNISRFNVEGSTPGQITQVIEIGDWDMDSLETLNIAHGLTFSKIKSPAVALIRNNLDTSRLQLDAGHTDGFEKGTIAITSTDVVLRRITGGVFDSSFFDSTSFNRGWITITSEQ